MIILPTQMAKIYFYRSRFEAVREIEGILRMYEKSRATTLYWGQVLSKVKELCPERD